MQALKGGKMYMMKQKEEKKKMKKEEIIENIQNKEGIQKEIFQ